MTTGRASQPPPAATSQYTFVRETPPLPVNATATSNIASANAPAAAQQRHGPGILVRSTMPVGGKEAYILDQGPQKPILYVVPQPGMDLRASVGRSVEVTGPVEAYSNGRRQYVIRALQVTPK
jgi:hypothetical protein